MSTPMGPIPVDLARRVVAGSDAAVIGVAVSLTQPATTSAAIATLLTVAYLAAFTVRGR